MTFSRALMDTYEDGLINCWFDHDKPTYQADANKRVTSTTAWTIPRFAGSMCGAAYIATTGRCYDGHDGLDTPPDLKNVPPIPLSMLRRRAGPFGSALAQHATRSKPSLIDQFATTMPLSMGHLNSVTCGSARTSTWPATGHYGNTATSTGVHLHFVVYFNRNSRDPWITDSTPALREELVDPLG